MYWLIYLCIGALIVICAVATFLWAATAIVTIFAPAIDEGDYIDDEEADQYR
jgi:hypothetical protein